VEARSSIASYTSHLKNAPHELGWHASAALLTPRKSRNLSRKKAKCEVTVNVTYVRVLSFTLEDSARKLAAPFGHYFFLSTSRRLLWPISLSISSFPSSSVG
jgi:hypothetical protein